MASSSSLVAYFLLVAFILTRNINTVAAEEKLTMNAAQEKEIFGNFLKDYANSACKINIPKELNPLCMKMLENFHKDGLKADVTICGLAEHSIDNILKLTQSFEEEMTRAESAIFKDCNEQFQNAAANLELAGSVIKLRQYDEALSELNSASTAVAESCDGIWLDDGSDYGPDHPKFRDLIKITTTFLTTCKEAMQSSTPKA